MRPPVYLRDVVSLALDATRCKGCGMCQSVCPHNVFTRSGGKVEIDARDACMECGACQRNCPHGAVSVKPGVGCAAAVINQMLGRKDACCTIEGDGSGPNCC